MNITTSNRSQIRTTRFPSARTYDPTFGEFNYVPARSTIQCSHIGSNETHRPTLKESAEEASAIREFSNHFCETEIEITVKDYMFVELMRTWVNNAEHNRIAAVYVEISAEELEQQRIEKQQWDDQDDMAQEDSDVYLG